MLFEVIVELKKEVLDSEGRAIQQSLSKLGHKDLKDVEVSKRFVLSLDSKLKEAEALKAAEHIAHEFLANTVSQTYKVRKMEEEA